MLPTGTVFIVDDDAACRDSTCELVSSIGLSAQSFASAAEFLAAFDSAESGCLVTDLRMPGMDGLALQRHLIELGARIPVVFTSGSHSDIASAVQAIRNGAVDFVLKPYHGARLIDSILAALCRDAALRVIEERMRTAAETGRSDAHTGRARDELSLASLKAPGKVRATDSAVIHQMIARHRRRLLGRLGAKSLADLLTLELTPTL